MDENKEIANDSGTGLLIEILEERWKTYRSELKRCIKEPSEEAIHDLRVATRRLLALVDMLREVAPHPRLQKLRSAFKSQLDSLNDLRDTQVMRVEIVDTIKELPELAPFEGYLTIREKRLLRSTAKAVRSYKSENIRKRLDSVRKTLLKRGNKRSQQHELLQTVDDAYETALRRYQRIDQAQPATIHRVRVAFKKFRYMVEIIFPLLADFPEDKFKQMHDYQGMMGDIQDMEVFTSTFEEFAEKDASYDAEPVRRFYQQRYVEVINAFMEDMHQINIFWRPDPETPFPWESQSRKKKKSAKKDKAGSLHKDEQVGGDEQVETEQEAQT